MRREFNDEAAIAADLNTACAAISRILVAWIEALPPDQRERAGDALSGGIRLGMLIAGRGPDEPPTASIIGLDADGAVGVLADLDYKPRHYSA